MKKYTCSFILIFSCMLLFCACSKDKASTETTTTNDSTENKSSSLEVISPDYITSNNEDSSEVFANIYVSDIDSDSIVNKKVKVNEISSESILEELKNEDVVTSNTSVKSFSTFEDQEDNLVGVLNLSKEFYNFNLGSGFESMMLNSVAKTYIENFNLDKFKILVDDEEYESGHILMDKDEYFTKDSLEE
ncbi:MULTISPECIES: GerMN domain-containing protein [unclassified Romboutsia]|uniref:GerMN domain-containing protein n=1 Tax=unclassified Romboutsia TaxID=2626894 RepID=UPI000821C653|nr:MULTISPECIES: GerMN domain-containing protein [unclassified Romboutsia]SCH02813.1 Uncharacterised protein [uncultured Clostridium sp.]